MSATVGCIFVAVACVALFHDAFSTYEYLSTMKTLGKSPLKLPFSIIAEAFFSLFTFIIGIVMASRELKDITYRGELAHRAIDDHDVRTEFIRLSKRGKILFGDSNLGR
ncbi:hypothetical protein L204_101312 [Cryptococcus depauperatus]